LNFNRHFAALTVALAVIIVLSALHWMGEYLLVSFAAYGALHAVSVVVAISTTVPLKRTLFVLLAAVLNVGIMYLGIFCWQLLQVLATTGRLHAALGICAFSGAIAYGLLIRGFWFKKLTPRRIAQIAIVCLIASQFALFAEDFQLVLGNWWFVCVWWFAFSASLWLLHRRTHLLGPHADA
jgi:hypothetical protein